MKYLATLIAIVMLIGCENYPSKDSLFQISNRVDPDSFTLEQGYNSYVSRTIIDDGIEVGRIRLKDGTSAKYWFKSHHLTEDMGGTWFSINGEKIYMAGWFCCELQLPEVQLQSYAELKQFVEEHHGINP